MDDTQQSRASDAAATRKRRSSILKSQRPPRTPFSELEFTVATPTDTAKSRRVSFSRRTGVAEFVTNEATTTWKNFYEEHNKSLESSGNESGANPPRPPVGHIGKRIFDQQFQEVEAVDFISTLDHSNRNVNASMNNVNFTQQLASLECTRDEKLSAPQQNFEMSAFTDQQSKLFGDDLTAPTMGEMSGRINVDFSAVQTLLEVKDDLDEIQKDLERQSNVVCPGPFSGRKSLSEYIEVDLNATHVSIRNDEQDMSITDTIQSPKVQDVSKNSSQINKKTSFSQDWVADKENIALNPYATPIEATNFAINDESDKILVFDGKRLTVQSDREADMILKASKEDCKPKETKPHQRKTIVLNVNDDLPNFIDDPMSTTVGASFKRSMMYDDDISLTQPLEAKVDSMPEKSILNETGNISITQAVSNVILPAKNEKRRTIVDNCDISMTQALNNVILPAQNEKRRTIVDNCDISMTQALSNVILPAQNEKRRTIVDNCDISVTQSINNVILPAQNEKRRTIVDNCDISVTQSINNVILPAQNEKRRTIVDNCDISITQGISNVILPAKNEKRRTIVDNCDISITQALPTQIIGTDPDRIMPERRRTILYENDTGNISITQAIPANIILNEQDLNNEKSKTLVFDNDNMEADISMTQVVPSNLIESKNQEEGNKSLNVPAEGGRRKTIVFEDENCDISMTQVLPSKIITTNENKLETNRRRTILYDDDLGDISVTQAIPTNIMFNEKSIVDKSRTVMCDDIENDISMTQAVPSNLILPSNDSENSKVTTEKDKRRTIVFDNEDCDISVTRALPSKIIIPIENKSESDRRKTIVYENDTGNLSITQAIPANILVNDKDAFEEEKRKTIVEESSESHISETEILPSNVILSVTTTGDKSKTIISDKDLGDISITRIVPTNIILPKESISEKRKTIVYEDGLANISITQALPANIMQENNERRKTIINESLAEVPVAQAVLVNVLIVNNATEKRKTMNDVEVQSLDKTKVIEDDASDSKSVSQTSEVQNEPAKARSEDEDTADELKDDVRIRIKNDLSEHMSITGNAPLALPEPGKVNTEDNGVTSSDSLIYIIRDTESGTQTDKEDKVKSLTWKSDVPRINSPLSIGYDEMDKEVTADLPKKIDELKSIVHKESSPTKNSQEEKSPSPDSDKKSMKSDDDSASKSKKTFRDANDTNELLEMLSDLTDRPQLNETGKVEEKIGEPRRLSVAPNRLSIVLSREDLLNNISMAQAALQRSIDTDESMEDTTSDTPVDRNVAGTKKSVRVSNEVVKKLQFEDESNSEASLKCDLQNSSLLKKSTHSENYVQEAAAKGKVIPSYLKDVSDGIKALMHDLVKPNADTIPFQGNERNLAKEPSTCSTQIQANLVTSSQIDLDAELTSETDSGYALGKMSAPSLDKPASPISIQDISEVKRQNPLELSFRPKRHPSSPPSQDRVIVFDQHNPLNNILLAPMDYSDVHGYNPPKSNDTLSVDSQFLPTKEKSLDMSNAQFVGSVTVTRSILPSGDSVPDKSDAQSLLSNSSKPMSVDESISVRVCELKDTKVNTVIAMKGNKELLEASSSLTLVDDTLAKNTFDVDVTTAQSSSSTNVKTSSPVHVIYQNDDPKTAKKLDSDFTSTDEIMEPSVTITTKGKKRNYSPSKRDKRQSAISALDVTPKPISKMQKLSTSPITHASDFNTSVKGRSPKPQRLTAEKDDSFKTAESDEKHSKKRSPRKPKSPHKPGTNITVQQLITEFDINPDIDQEALSKQIIQALSNSDSSTAPNTISFTDIRVDGEKSPEIVSSFTSSKNQDGMREAISVTTTATETETRTTSSKSRNRLDWQPEVSETTSNFVSECESSVNVVAKIDMLPFMGSHECEWEASGADTWSFRLLHARLRLSARLAHRHDNAARARVRADTPVLAVTLDTAHKDKKNSVAQLCVGFAAEAMRYFVGQGCARAGDVPALLRRCAGVARVALRWGRAMHEARLHLAYSLPGDTTLALKVANIPLRSVWEVTMRLELVVEDAREVPWPRACDVRVSRVVSDVRVTDEEVRRLLAPLPRDWGHVPRTIWKIFRYLKNKTREDELLGL